MKPLLLIITLLFSTPAWAEEIIMLCKDEYFEEAYRYTEKLFGDDIVEIRVDGRWEIWPLPKKNIPDESKLKRSTSISVKDLSAVEVITVLQIEGNETFPKGTTSELKYVIDFRLLSFKETLTHRNTDTTDEYSVPCKKL